MQTLPRTENLSPVQNSPQLENSVMLERKSFVGALAKLARITAKHPSFFALKYLRITTFGGTVTLTASNLGTRLSIDLPNIGHATAEIDLMVDCLELHRQLKSVKGQHFLLQEFDGYAQFTCEGITVKLPCGGLTKDLNHLPKFKPQFTLEAAQLSLAIEQVLYAAAASRQYGNMSCMLLELSEQRTRVVATDGYRLALTDFDAPIASKPKAKITAGKYSLEVSSARELERLSQSGKVEIALNDNFLFFWNHDTRLRLFPRSGTYPAYEFLTLSDHAFTVQLERNEVLDAINRLRQSNREASGLALNIGPSSLTLSFHDTDQGEQQTVQLTGNVGAVVSMQLDINRLEPAVAHANERFELAFNNRGPVTIISPNTRTVAVIGRLHI